MAKTASGTVVWVGGQWKVRVTDPRDPTKRPYIPIPDVPKDEPERARALGEIIAKHYRSGDFTDSPTETVSEWADKWFDAREAAGLKSGRADRSRFKTHIEPHIGHKPIGSINRHDIERMVAAWDQLISDGVTSWKTLANAWGLVTKMFVDARRSKKVELRRRDDNPTEEVEGPNRGARRSKAFLYPDEFLKLVSCPEVPLRWRRLIALAIYLYPRRGELAALRRSDVDLAHSIVHVHSAEGEDGEIRELKTATQIKRGTATRRVAIEPALMPLLASLCANLHDDDALVEMPHWSMLSGEDYGLRRWLKVAGIKRKELFADDATRKNITWHDLRATGITWLAVQGEEPLRIMQRAGHSNFNTTMLYVREAENLKAGFGTPFPELPTELLTGGAENRPRIVQPSVPPHVTAQKDSDKMRPQRDSNNFETRENKPNRDTIVFEGRQSPPSLDEMIIDSIDDYEGQLMAMLGER